jgi:hypothetical protein
MLATAHQELRRSGQRFKPSASDWNAFLDAAKAVQQLQPWAQGRQTAAGATVLVKNTSGGDVAAGEVLGIADVVIDPADNLREFQNCPAVVGVTPVSPDHSGRVVVMTTPAANGAFGHGVIAEMAVAKVVISDATHRFADIDGSTRVLRSAAGGPIALLWVQAGTGTKWALVRLGLPSGATSGPVVLGSNTEGSEAASTDTWSLTNGHPLDLWVVCRVVYNDGGDKALYSFLRKLSFDTVGILRSVSVETRVTIDGTETC